MGLKISYVLAVQGDAAVAREMIDALHARALRMDFDVVSRVLRRRVGQWSSDESVEAACFLRPTPRSYPIEVPPLDGSWFTVYVDGSEPASIGLATRPGVVERASPCTDRPGGSGTNQSRKARSRRVRTGLDGLAAWQGTCKTQYAALPEHGGVDNFLRAHVQIVDLLEAARSLGVDIDMHDDGGYAIHHDPALLLESLASWNRMLAAMAAYLKETVDESVYGPLEAPILAHPDFERLAAEGREEFEAVRTGRAGPSGPTIRIGRLPETGGLE